MENKKNTPHQFNDKKNKNLSNQISKPEPLIIGKEAFLILDSNTKAKAIIFGIRYSKNRVHYDLNVSTEKGIIPFYNIDSVLVKF